MKLYQFNADQAGTEEADGVLTVGVASSLGPYFLIQRSLAGESEGTEALYCEYDDQGNGTYGAVRRIELSRELMRVELGHGTTVSATLEIAEGAWTTLRQDLSRVLEGIDGLLYIR